MKKAFLLGILATQLCARAQDNWGKIILKNIGIPKSDGSGTYDVPLRDYINQAGLGAYTGGATLGLFLADNSPFSTPFATAGMGTTSAQSPFAVNPASQTVAVPGYAPGSRAVIVIRAWTGSSWGSGLTGEWVFTTLPLGGTPPGGGAEIPTPSLTGWGPEDGSGITVSPWPPHAFVSGPAQGAVFAAPATIQIGAGFGGDPGVVATNLAVYAGSILVANDASAAPGVLHKYTTPPLGPGTYSLYAIAHAGYVGYGSQPPFIFTGATQSIPINITVVDPVAISLTPPAVANGQLTFQYTVNPGLTYTVQTSSDLKTWQTVETNTPTSSPALFTRAMSGAPAAFYQVQRVPNP